MDKKFLLILLIILCLVQNVSGFSVNGVTTTPSGILTSGTSVSTTFTINFGTSSDLTFPAGSDLVMTTELANPTWTYVMLLDGVENSRTPSTASTLTLTGFELSYPSSVNESLRFTLTGNIPSSSTSTQKILNIKEIDTSGNIVTATVYDLSMPVTPAPSISSLSPGFGYNTTDISNVVITGSSFSTSGATVVLAKTGQTNITGTITSASATQLTCSFPTTGKLAGNWNVIVTNADGQSATRTNGFEIRSLSSIATLSSIAPSSALTNTTVSITNLAGTNFQDSATIRLRRTYYNDIYGTVSSLTSTKITGTFPLTNQVPGDYQVCVINPGSDAICGLTFTITSPSDVTNGTLYFDTNPAGASVYLNNALKGTTALTVNNITPGSYSVMYRLTGYETYSETVKVTSGNKTTVYAKLVASTAATTAPTAVPTTAPTTVKTTRVSTIAVPTKWVDTPTPTPASPLEGAVIIGAIGIGIMAVRRKE